MLTEAIGEDTISVGVEATFVLVLAPLPGRTPRPPFRNPPVESRSPRETLAREAAERLTQRRSPQL